MADIVKQMLARPIQLADQVIKLANQTCNNKQDCSNLKSQTENLAALLRQAARASSDLYERPTKRIIDRAEQVLEKTLLLVLKCRNNGLFKRVFIIVPASAFKKISSQLEISAGDISWLLRVSAPNKPPDEYLGLPPIATNEPILCLIWEQIAILYSGTLDDRSDAAALLVSLARDNARNRKLIIEEGGVSSLLKLAKEGKLEGQENAALALGLLGRDPASVEHMIHAGVCSVFVNILKHGSMKAQAVVAWAVSEMVSHHPKYQDIFLQHNIVRLLVGHLAYETVEEHSKYSVSSNKPISVHAVVVATINNDDPKNRAVHPVWANYPQPFRMHSVVASTIAMKSQPNSLSSQGSNGTLAPDPLQEPENVVVKKPNHQQPHRQHSTVWMSVNSFHKARELEDPATKAYMKAMAARALWHLAIGNLAICRSITESRALLCFSVLLEKGAEDVQYKSAMALMEITSVAEQDSELRRSAFKANSPACKAIVEQLLKIIQKPDSRLLLPCIKALGNLARTFRATESQMIQPLVEILDDREAEITKAAADALTKFACSENYLHIGHSKAIISAGGAKHLIQLVYFGEKMVQVPALILLCYIARHIPDSEDLAQAKVLTALEWASKQSLIIKDESVVSLLEKSISCLEIYQSRGSH